MKNFILCILTVIILFSALQATEKKFVNLDEVSSQAIQTTSTIEKSKFVNLDKETTKTLDDITTKTKKSKFKPLK